MIRGKEMDEMFGEMCTVRDIEALPAGKRAELIDGQMYMMASPERPHQQILGRLYRIIADYIDEKGGDCEVNLAPLAVMTSIIMWNRIFLSCAIKISWTGRAVTERRTG